MEATHQQNNFRSGYINNVLALFYSAESMSRDRQNRQAANAENYKGQLLSEMNRVEEQRCRNNLETVCGQIEILRDKETELLTKQKENELIQPPNPVLENLANMEDIITREELQLYADKYKESPLVQRRIRRIADKRGFHISTYPEFDKKIETVLEIASAFISYIKSGNFGLEPAAYIESSLHDYDKVLS